jgi:hypothetical protein
MKSWLIILLFLPITTFSQIRDLVDGYDLYTYGEWISGEFTSTSQSIEDTYFDNIFINTVKFRGDTYGDWFYTEQGEIVDGIPYKIRVYILSYVDDTTLLNQVYKIKTENFNSGIDLPLLKFDDLEEMSGCHTYIYKSHNGNEWYYYGETNGKNCKSSFRAPTYTTSQFRLYEDRIISWDRGWDDSILYRQYNTGAQIWGSTKGPYEYLKIK